MDGAPTVKGHPFRYSHALSDSSNPFYFVDHGDFYPVCMQDNWFRRVGPRPNANNHDAWETFVHCQYNFLCVNRRSQGVIHVA
jgi:hypothetical protein